MAVRDKFATTRMELGASLIERDAEVDLILTALIAQENVLLVSPPGCAKSLLANRVTEWIGGEKFSILLTKFTTPDECLGPVSVIGLKNDRFARIIDRKLPTATVAFIDEVFRASSAILNCLLSILNERNYQNDSVLVKCPLRLCIGASNEWPSDEGGKELNALFDRFLFRKLVRPIGTSRGLDQLLWSGAVDKPLSTVISNDELDQAAGEARALDWSAEARTAFVDIIGTARREGIIAGDRRLRKSVHATQAYAWLNGADQVGTDHLEILSHVLWDDPTEQPKKLAEIIGTIANPSGMKVNGLLLEAEQIISATNLAELAQTAAADKKLRSIHKSLKEMGPRGVNAAEYVAGEIKRIRIASAEVVL